ncbi:Fur family ferric uptake transcriptional regulator [Parabacteroides sp. PFB2-10]|uniref:Fur family transcriptional regulator n=1 Tax=Parabacteroides sp. PFB2-10 TaxID=1742405 RepID=UPI0024747100|nr:transcriptional repressor [Parabacteroides sp. PFB2-10]MDH6314217.1 Fur family ferric uptake transcriptional regulator [Parabacteroides sp. PFB2-10]MDL2244193.1 transcriptional repressor [Parabacteroides sp. OttesenSCG-928-J18]
METKLYSELKQQFTDYLVDKKMRRTEERYTILKHISEIEGHFDMVSLHEQLDTNNFHVSLATLYNNVDHFIQAGLVVRHHISPQIVQYELRIHAETHQHLVCTHCGDVREIRNKTLRADIKNLKLRRFTPEYASLYIYGICSKCTFRIRQEKRKSN